MKIVSKKKLIKRVDYMLKNSEYEKVLYFYWFIGLKLGILNSEKEV